MTIHSVGATYLMSIMICALTDFILHQFLWAPLILVLWLGAMSAQNVHFLQKVSSLNFIRKRRMHMLVSTPSSHLNKKGLHWQQERRMNWDLISCYSSKSLKFKDLHIVLTFCFPDWGKEKLKPRWWHQHIVRITLNI